SCALVEPAESAMARMSELTMAAAVRSRVAIACRAVRRRCRFRIDPPLSSRQGDRIPIGGDTPKRQGWFRQHDTIARVVRRSWLRFDLSRSEKNEDGQRFLNIMKSMFFTGGNIDRRSRLHSDLNALTGKSGAARDDVIDLILTMW